MEDFFVLFAVYLPTDDRVDIATSKFEIPDFVWIEFIPSELNILFYDQFIHFYVYTGLLIINIYFINNSFHTEKLQILIINKYIQEDIEVNKSVSE